MDVVMSVVVVGIALVLAWGLVAPRGLWRATVGWTVSEPERYEPGASGYLVRRVLSALGLAAVAAVLVPAVLAPPANDVEVPPLTAIEEMWGNPVPTLVNREYVAASDAPESLVSMPILGYQDLESTSDSQYFADLADFSLLGEPDPAGYVGQSPEPSFSVRAEAYLVVEVRGPLLCIPRQVVVNESEDAVRIGVFYGVAGDGDHLAGCPTEGVLTAPVLVPIYLGSAVGERAVEDLAGEPLAVVTAY